MNPKPSINTRLSAKAEANEKTCTCQPIWPWVVGTALTVSFLAVYIFKQIAES